MSLNWLAKLFSSILSSSSRSLEISSICEFSILTALSSFSTPLLENTLISTTVPLAPGGTLKLVSLTSAAFSPKIALKSFSSGVIGDSPLGVTFPTNISPDFTSAPI